MLLVVFIIRCVPRWALVGAHLVLGLPRRAHASMASRRSVVEHVYESLGVGIAASAASAASHSGSLTSLPSPQLMDSSAVDLNQFFAEAYSQSSGGVQTAF